MQIIASSIQQVANQFLHAGYISAYPRTFYPHSYGYKDPELQIEVTEALRLKGEVLANLVSAPDSGMMAATASSGGGSWPAWMAVASAMLFGAVALLYLLTRRGRNQTGSNLTGLPAFGVLGFQPAPPPKPSPLQGGGLSGLRWRASPSSWRITAAAAMALLGIIMIRCGGLEPLPTEAPWKGVQLEQYNDPSSATKVLLYGLISEGIANVGQPIEMLANIQNEVGLPVKSPSKGQAYALKTYGIDGWGKAFRLVADKGIYTVTSAGADGQFDTADDLKVAVAQCTDGSWDNQRHAFFLRQHNKDVAILFHRWTGEHFQYRNRSQAEALTGGVLYDFFTTADLSGEQRTNAEKAYNASASGVSHDPLLLQYYSF